MLNMASGNTGLPNPFLNMGTGMLCTCINRELPITTTILPITGIPPNLAIRTSPISLRAANGIPTPCCNFMYSKVEQSTLWPWPTITITMITGIQPISHGTRRRLAEESAIIGDWAAATVLREFPSASPTMPALARPGASSWPHAITTTKLVPTLASPTMVS